MTGRGRACERMLVRGRALPERKAGSIWMSVAALALALTLLIAVMSGASSGPVPSVSPLSSSVIGASASWPAASTPE